MIAEDRQRELIEAQAQIKRLQAEHRAALKEQADNRSAMLFMLEDLEETRQKIDHSHQEWMAALDVVDDPIFMHDKQFRILRCNKAYQRCAGIPFHEIIGKPYFEVFPKTQGPQPCCMRLMEKAAKEEEGVQQEELTVGAASYYSRAYMIRDEQDKYLYSVHTLEDITGRRQKEAELRIINERLSKAQHIGRIGFLDWDLSTNEVELSDETLRIYGIAPGRGRYGLEEITKLVHPEDAAYAERSLRSAIENGSMHDIEHRIVRADGTVVYVHTPAEVLRDSNGKPLRVLGTVRDITERKLSELALHESEIKFRSIIESSPVAMAVNDEHQNITFLNRRFIETIGYTLTDIPTLAEWWPRAYPDPVYRQRVAQEWQMALEKAQHDGTEFEPMEHQVTCKNGSVRNIRFSTTTMGTSRLVIFYDITERKLAEEKMLASELRYRRLFESAKDGILILDAETGMLLDANPFITELLGYSLADCLGKHIWDIGFLKNVAANKDKFLELQQQSYVRYENLPLETALGQTIYVEFISNVYQAGKGRVIQCNIRDISERKRSEVALQRTNRALRTLSAGNESLIHAIDESQLLKSMCRAVVEKGGYRMAWVGYTEQDAEQSIRLMAQDGFDEGYLEQAHITWADTERGQGPTGRAARTCKIQIAQNIALDPDMLPWRAAAAKNGYFSSIALPLLENDKCFGVLTIYAAEPDAFDTETLKILEEMAGDLVFGILTLRIKVAHGEQEQRLKKSMLQTVQAIASIVEMRDPYTAGHQARVAELARGIARQMGMTEEMQEVMHLAGLVHDLGKIRVPAEILSKPGRLNDFEYSLIKMHPQAGYDILKDIDFSWPIAQMVLQHHERLDGSGYPQGLMGEEIVLGARILCVADVVEAMSSHRPYRPGLGIEAALEEITRLRGTHFDAQVVDACLSLFNEQKFKLVGKHYLDIITHGSDDESAAEL